MTTGYQSAIAKNNEQLPEGCEEARELGAEIAAALSRSQLFPSFALPHAIFPPLFNRYETGEISATLFLSDPDEYGGGELVIEDGHDAKRVKLPAGHLFLYPATTVHSITPVASGARVASFFWIESLVASAAHRAMLFDLDLAIQSLRPRVGDSDAALITLTGCYHNMLREWSHR